MTKFLKKKQRGVIAQLCSSLDVSTLESSISPDLQKVLDNHSKVFETPKFLPRIGDHDHALHFFPGCVPPNVKSYRYPYAQKSEIERMVAEMLEAGIIQPSQSSLSAPVVLLTRRMDHGACFWIIGSSISSLLEISFRFLSLMNYWMNSMDQFTSPSWVFVQDIIK